MIVSKNMLKAYAKFALLLALCSVAGAQTAVSPFSGAYLTFTDPATGLLCAGCKLATYSAGTTSPLATFVDSTGTTTNQNPIILDAAGGAFIWTAQGSYYKFALSDPLGTLLWTVDNLPGGGASGGGGSGAVLTGTAGQVAVYPGNGTTVSGASSINGITVDGSSPVAIGYVANVTSDIQAQLNALAPLASPAFTGIPTGPSDSCGAHTGMLVNEAYVAACATGGGGGGPGSAGEFCFYSSTGNTCIGSSNWGDQGTYLQAFEPIHVYDPSGLGAGFEGAEGTAPSGVSGSDAVWADSAAHRVKMNNNGGTSQVVPGVTSAGTAGDLWMVPTDTYGLVDSNIPALSVLTLGSRQLTCYSPGTMGTSASSPYALGACGGSAGNFTTGLGSGNPAVLFPTATSITGMYALCTTKGTSSGDALYVYTRPAGSATWTQSIMTVPYGSGQSNETMYSDTTPLSILAGEQVAVAAVSTGSSSALANCSVTLTY